MIEGLEHNVSGVRTFRLRQFATLMTGALTLRKSAVRTASAANDLSVFSLGYDARLRRRISSMSIRD